MSTIMRRFGRKVVRLFVPLAQRFAPLQIGVHHLSLDRPGSHDRDLDDEVVKFHRLEPWQHRHLRAAFDLEHAHRVGLADHLVRGLVGVRDVVDRERLTTPLRHELQAAADRGEHAAYRGGTRLRRRFPNVHYLRRHARGHVPSFVFEYMDGGAGMDTGIAHNWAALDAVELVPRYGVMPRLPPVEV